MERKVKMSIADRAKQFMPFAVLRGYEDLINETKLIKQERKELTSEQAIALSEKISKINKHDVVKITHYENGYYKTTVGAVTSIDLVFRKITVIKKQISFEDILEIN